MNLDLKIWLKECISNLAQLTLGSFEVISGQNISDPSNHMVEILNLKSTSLGLSGVNNSRNDRGHREVK